MKYDAAIFHPEILETAFSVYRAERRKFFFEGGKGQFPPSPIAPRIEGGGIVIDKKEI